MTFPEIFDSLLVPRENGSAALQKVAAWLQQVGDNTGAVVTVHEFLCRPYEQRLAGLVVLAVGIAFAAAIWRRRVGWALVLALLLPVYMALELEYGTGLASAGFTVPESNVVLSFPVADAARTVILGAHYDTKTDLFDHVQRAPIQFLVLPFLLITIGTAISGWRRVAHGMSLTPTRVLAVIIAAYYFALFLTLSGGAFVSRRSPGALDDGSSVAVLLQVAAALGDGGPRLQHTNVDIVLFAGEEVGLQGSRAYVRDHRAELAPSSTYFINAEGLGMGPKLRYFTSDRTSLRRYDASSKLVRLLDDAARLSLRQGIDPDPLPVTTDAHSFMAAGIPSVTVGSHRGRRRPVRGLHSARDTRERIEVHALEQTVRFYLAALRTIDRS